jgi:two-component system OmpR family sensor kinase
MGRLYWKFFIFFFLAQLTSVIGVGIAVSIVHEREELQREHEVQMQTQDQSFSPPALSKPFKQKHKRWFPLMPILVGAIASFIFAAILAWYFSKPIKQLRQAFASAANGNLDMRVGESMGSRRDELVDLGNAFDVMAIRLGALLQSQTRLLHQVSHELRSPLARLQIAVGLARQQPDKLESSLTRIERESERMDDLVGELLALSRLESGVIKLDKERVNLNELLITVLEDARFEGEARKISIDYVPQVESCDTPLSLLGQQDLLHRAIDNVVRNALKYSASQSHVTIKTSVENAFIKIEVNDQGAGVAEDELGMIFQAFFRGSNTNQADGHGVGLAIAKQIIEAHGGTITASNIATGGLSVAIKLPVT